MTTYLQLVRAVRCYKWYEYYRDNKSYLLETECEPSKHSATTTNPDILVYWYNLDSRIE